MLEEHLWAWMCCGGAYLALQVADEQTLEDLARLVRVADILESLGRVLATNVEEDLLTTAACALASSTHRVPVRASISMRDRRGVGCGTAGRRVDCRPGGATYGCSSTKLVQS